MATTPLPSQGAHSGNRSIWLQHPRLLRVSMVEIDQYGYIAFCSLYLFVFPIVGREEGRKMENMVEDR